MAAKTFKAQQIDWRARARFPKNNFFCYKWRVIDNFNKSIERDLFEMNLQGGNFHKALVNEQVLALYKMSYHTTKNDFMSQITKNAQDFLENRRKALSDAAKEETTYTASMSQMMHAMFNILLSCSIELNTVLGFSELFIAATEPEVLTITKGRQTKLGSLNARLTTTLFSLVIHGQRNQIAAYVLPVEDLINLSTAGKEPMVLLQARREDDDAIIWEIDDEPLDEDMLEETCLTLLHQLVQKTQDLLGKTAVA